MSTHLSLNVWLELPTTSNFVAFAVDVSCCRLLRLLEEVVCLPFAVDDAVAVAVASEQVGRTRDSKQMHQAVEVE